MDEETLRALIKSCIQGVPAKYLKDKTDDERKLLVYDAVLKCIVHDTLEGMTPQEAARIALTYEALQNMR